MAAKKRDRDHHPESDQRRWPRLEPSSVPFLKGISFNQGSEVQVVNISRGGVLLETEVRLRPQMKLNLKLLTCDGLIKLEGTVLRSSISSLKGAPRYRSAIAFEHPFHMLDDLSEEPAVVSSEDKPESAAPPASEQGSDLPLSLPVLGEFDESSASMTFVALDISSSALLDMFKRNDW